MDLGGGLGTETLLSEILKRLPVKSLVRFRSVSKPWSHRINDPFFVTSHLQFHKSSSSSSSSLLGIFRSDYSRKNRWREPQFEYFRIDHTEVTKTTLEHLKIPLLWPHISIRGHCNGIVLAFDSHTFFVNEWTPKHHRHEAKWKTFHVDRYIICNPIARRFFILPESTIELPNLYSEVNLERDHEYKKLNAIGLGFIDDVVYKVVRVTYGMEEVQYNNVTDFRPYKPPWVEAYDSRSCYWRRAPMNSEFSYQHLKDGVYNSFDGCLYWLGRGYGNRDRYSTLVWFHLVDETWQETLLPYKSWYDNDHEDGVFGEYGVCQSVRILGESVVLLVGDLRNELLCNVWKMNKEEDNKVSWTHMYRLIFDGSPLGFIGNGELLLISKDDKKLVLHDSKKMNDACFGFTDLDFKVGDIVPDFVESLVLLDGENGFIEDVSEETYGFHEEPRERGGEEEEDLGDLSSMFDDNL